MPKKQGRIMSDINHHRINEQLEHYWHEIRGDRAMPMEGDVNITKIKDIWDHCFLVNVHHDKFAYSYLGPKLIEAYGDDLTGKEIATTLLEPHPHSLYSKFQQVVAQGAPTNDESEFKNSQGLNVKYRACIMPLGSPGHTGVAFLLGGMKWKAY
jgi:hypothetical protein